MSRHTPSGALALALSLASLAALFAPGPLSAQTQPPGSAATARTLAAAAPSAEAPKTPPALAQPPAGTEAGDGPPVFGAQMFKGHFGNQSFTGFNPDYQVAVGDRITVRMWGAYSHDTTLVVDAQGNIFLPNIGPVQVQGVRNGDLNDLVQRQIKRVFRANVQSYATLDAAQPVKLYVTGFVRQPGLYNGVSSNSVLYYLDQAGGIDAERGSYLDVEVLRGGRTRARFNLYKFLLEGRIEHVQFQDGDTIIAHQRKHAVRVLGEAANAYVFETERPEMPASELIALARPRAGATHLSIVRKVGPDSRSEYHAIADAAKVVIANGDEVTFTSDKYPGTILVRVEGAHKGERTLVLPYGTRLSDALARVKPSAQASLAGTQLFRRSVAARQKEMLDTSLRSLETYALTARSATSEEAALRTREAELMLQFITRARSVQPRGQIVLGTSGTADSTQLEDGDIIRIPEQSNLVLVSGEVLFPNALVHDAKAGIDDYVERAGGYNQGADKARVIVLHQDGRVATRAEAAKLQPGDEILVLPRIDTKSIEITRGITQIIYQVAVAAKVLLGL